jgi:hypothetical protein
LLSPLAAGVREYGAPYYWGPHVAAGYLGWMRIVLPLWYPTESYLSPADQFSAERWSEQGREKVYRAVFIWIMCFFYQIVLVLYDYRDSYR